ncbi:hypothetical protein PIB30_112308, partial [Stylosanthes scabra]|nr:hypothetical protein [Stylosanthes scabra]
MATDELEMDQHAMAEEDLTQGHPQSQPQDEQFLNDQMRHPVVEASTLGGGGTSVVSKTAAASHQHQFVRGSAAASSVRKGVFRSKIPIRRKLNPTVVDEV